MKTIRIHDVMKNGVLAFDLRDLLRLLAPRSLQAVWRVSTVKSGLPELEWFDATGDGGEKLELLANRDAVITGQELLALAKQTTQVIWGEFSGYFPNATHDNWLTIRAIDSSYYEITTADEAVLKKLKDSFQHIGPADIPFAPNPADLLR
ncbi:hypothetical protein [Agrobacterium vitis]|uniref:hypothetical protein n=1 Tax=Agrobacterium vitis TaxID=373 RepID=UPI00114CD083|nr:hypothetical protein [Agrobacterium vitis]MCE6073966.1 hypothetical protein [Agrobacterium vitis]MCM2468797.1 hypothetical protein [Agrobacterium vitis]MUO71488.1 hypothetical protein [Agrobacterium vitis]MUO86122.1 hypothetical protein [Agrobacterium vitis]MVA34139.1 hypothetical protein [Agrobacterium vitis]